VLAVEIERILKSGEPITDVIAEELAHTFLPKVRLQDQIKDAGEQLSHELATVSQAIQIAQRTNASYSQQLAGVSLELSEGVQPSDLKHIVFGLSQATTRVQTENASWSSGWPNPPPRSAACATTWCRCAATRPPTASPTSPTQGVDEELERTCAEADCDGSTLHLAVLDIDHFKVFNDTWGHQTGDQVLRYVASVIGRVGAPPRFAARYGGEEFAMIFVRESANQVEQTLHEIAWRSPRAA